jgi:hypothetical protein
MSPCERPPPPRVSPLTRFCFRAAVDSGGVTIAQFFTLDANPLSKCLPHEV